MLDDTVSDFAAQKETITMDSLLESLESVQKDFLRCAVCKHYLSVPPIVHNKLIGSICGRESCRKIARSRGNSHPQISYEANFKYLKFPCINKEYGCEEMIPMDKMEEHEEKCELQKLLECSLCKWKGKTSDFEDHFKTIHSSYDRSTFVEINLKYFEKDEIYFCDVQEDLVIVRVVNGSNSSIHFKVWTNLNLFGNLKYRIKFFNSNNEVLAVSKLKIADYIHPNVFNNETDSSWLNVDVASINNIFEDPSFLQVRFYVDDFEITSDENIFYNSGQSFFEMKCFICDKETNCISTHLYNYHKSELRGYQWHCLDLASQRSIEKYPLLLHHFDGTIFILYICITEKNISYVHVNYFGTEESSDGYKYEISFMGAGIEKLWFTGFCHPVRNDPRHGYESEHSLRFIPDETRLDSLRYKLEIIKLSRLHFQK